MNFGVILVLNVLFLLSSSDGYNVIFVLPAAMQEKPHILQGDDEPCVKSPNQVTEDMIELEVISGDGTDEKFSEAASEADLIDNEPDGAAVEPHICIPGEEHNSEETQAPDHRETDPKKAGGKRKLQIQGKWKGVDPVVFFKDEAIINSIKTFYGIDESFPLNGHLVTRNNDTNHVKRIYYISKSVKDVLELSFSVGQQLKITSIGLKMFVSISICYSQIIFIIGFPHLLLSIFGLVATVPCLNNFLIA